MTPTRRPRPKKRKFSDPGRSYAKRLERYRPGLVPFVLDGLASIRLQEAGVATEHPEYLAGLLRALPNRKT